MKKVVYLENALEGLALELLEKSRDKKIGDRLSISAYYGNNSKLFRQSEIDGTIGALYRETGTALEQLAGDAGKRIIFQLINKENFEKRFTIKDSKPKVKESAKIESVQAEPVAEGTKEPEATKEPESVQEPRAEYNVSAFEQIKALLPALTEEEKKELMKLLKV